MKNTITAVAKEVMEVVGDKIVLLETSETPVIKGFIYSTKYEVTFLVYNEMAFRMLTAAFDFTPIKISESKYPMVFIMSQLENKGTLFPIKVHVDAGTVSAGLLADKVKEQKAKEQLKLFLIKSASDETEVVFACNEEEAKKLNPMNLDGDTVLVYDIPTKSERIAHY